MKWVTKTKEHKPLPSDGDERVISKFLFLPLSINDETRWLCLAKIKQRYYSTKLERIEGCSDFFGNPSFTGGDSWWSNKSWVD